MRNRSGGVFPLLVLAVVAAGSSIVSAGQQQGGRQAVVPLHVKFIDEGGRPVRDLSSSEVKVFESGSELEVERLLDPNTVFDVGLLLDVSPSVHEMVDITQRQTSRLFYSLPSESEALLLTFDTQTYVDCDWTTDRKEMDEAIFELGLHKPGDTSILYEALVVALEKKYRERGFRQVLIVLSDGVETGSHDVSEKESLRVVQDAGVLTFIIQSSSITTSLMVPMIAAGILSLEAAFPIVIGANIGTTGTSILASFATGNPSAIVIAFVHFLFNLIGVLVIYPIKPFRTVPINLAKALGDLAYEKRHYAIMYVLGVFFVVPGLLVLIYKLLT